MAWIDYRKAYDMVPHSWIVECMSMFKIAADVRTFVEGSMENWKTELTSSGESLGNVNIRRGIFQGDSLSPLIFVMCMIPLSLILRKEKVGYEFPGKELKINHLLFMDDLKMFGKNKQQIDSLVKTVNIVSKGIGMEFGIKKCGMLVMKRGKIVECNGIQLPDEETIKSVEEDGYNFLGILELDKIMEGEMKRKFVKEYGRRLRLVLKSKLNGRNKIMSMNTWAVALLRYGAGVLNWTKDEIAAMDRKTRKLMTLYGALHPRSDIHRLYLLREKGGRVAKTGVIETERCETKENFKKKAVEELEKAWIDKKMYGQYNRDLGKEVDRKNTWWWLKKGDLKPETEALLCAAQEQALRTNYVKFHIDRTVESPLCRLCGEKGEHITHLISECKKLAQKEYKRRHDNVARIVHWKLCGLYQLEKAENVVLKKEKECKIIDIAVPWDCRIDIKETEKVEKIHNMISLSISVKVQQKIDEKIGVVYSNYVKVFTSWKPYTMILQFVFLSGDVIFQRYLDQTCY
ncbi:Hypothetical predicted protein, partial [Paramuricea clavata]